MQCGSKHHKRYSAKYATDGNEKNRFLSIVSERNVSQYGFSLDLLYVAAELTLICPYLIYLVFACRNLFWQTH